MDGGAIFLGPTYIYFSFMSNAPYLAAFEVMGADNPAERHFNKLIADERIFIPFLYGRSHTDEMVWALGYYEQLASLFYGKFKFNGNHFLIENEYSVDLHISPIKLIGCQVYEDNDIFYCLISEANQFDIVLSFLLDGDIGATPQSVIRY